MKEKIAVVGLRRSGNHVLIEWISQNFRSVKHLNDCVIVNPGEYTTQSKTQTYRGNGTNDVHLYSFEERAVKDPSLFLIENGKYFDKVFFILRDAYNWGASILHGRGNWTLDTNIKIWKRYGYLYTQTPDGFLLYDKFLTETKYVQSVKVEYNLPNSPNNLPKRLPESGFGNGSSFKKKKRENSFNHHASDLVNRNRNIKAIYGDKSPPAWRKLLSDPEISELNEKIFGRSNECIN